MRMETVQEVLEKIKSLGWTVSEDGEHEYMIGKSSPAGQDFNIHVEGKTAEELVRNIYEAYDNFDVSEETYIWLDNTGHGKNGAPHHMRDVLEDMEVCEQRILDLYNALKNEEREDEDNENI